MTGGRAVVVTALVVLVAACSSGGDPEPVDLIAEIDEGEDLATTTDLLLNETADDPEVATPDGRAAALADEIAESVELAGELLPEDPAAFEEAAGGSPTSRFVLIGSTLGYTRAALDRIEDDGGDPVATVAFALRLGWDLGVRLEPGGDGLGWVVDDPDACRRPIGTRSPACSPRAPPTTPPAGCSTSSTP